MSASIGKPFDRIDGRAKVTGRALYSADIPVANVAHAVIVSAPTSNARIVSIDTTAATSARGVIAVFTHENAPSLSGADKKAASTDKVMQLLQDDQVLYDGSPVALVVADTPEHAEQAASLVAVRYDPRSAKCDLPAELGNGYQPESAGPAGKPDASRGDFDAAWKKATTHIEATYSTQEQTHNPMEPHATIAVWQGKNRLTVYDATQGIFGVRKRLAGLFGIPDSEVRVISHFIGGGFGCKGSSWSHVGLAAMAARELARPVKLVITRAQMFQLVGHRPRTIQKISLGAAHDGKLLAIKHEVHSHTSSFDDFVEPSAKQTRMLYDSEASVTTHRLVKLDISTPTFTRAPGEASGTFALESAIDELAHTLDIDPIELRLKNHADRDPDGDKPFSSKSLKECYQKGAEAFGWSARKTAPRSMRDGRWLVGHGMASATYPANQMPASAMARLGSDGKAVVLAGSQDIGTGTYTIMTQIAAETLGLEMEDVHFDLGDTTYPEASVSGGSSTAASVGSVVKRACAAVLEKLANLAIDSPASPLHGMTATELEPRDGALVSKVDPSKRESFADIVGRSGEPSVEARISAKESESRKGYSLHAFGAQFAEVRIDPDTGVIEVTRMVGAFAAGRILNRKTARSQFLGGMVWGIGLALLEHTERDLRTARVVTKDLADYHVPVEADVRHLEVVMVDEVDEHVNELGAKGIGEIGITGAAAAIANAVFHATGKRIRDLPITLDKLIDT